MEDLVNNSQELLDDVSVAQSLSIGLCRVRLSDPLGHQRGQWSGCDVGFSYLQLYPCQLASNVSMVSSGGSALGPQASVTA